MTKPKPLAFSYIRMSTDIQLKGDSLRRQLESSRAYALEHGFELVEENELKDIGLSAFDGSNLSDGALGRFLIRVRENKIPTGSYLLVESLDRISREEPVKALSTFLEILNGGVNIVTLVDKQTYTKGANFLALMQSVMILSRGNEESGTKSYRLTEKWAEKRKNVHLKKMTRRCPSWLTLSEDRTHFIIDKTKKKIVRSIFEDSAAGLGDEYIARKLNKTKVPTIGRASGWHASYVSRILNNPAVIGKYQPQHMIKGNKGNKRTKGKREPMGEVIENYFPTIIDEQLFNRVQMAHKQRRISGAGRKGASFANLFSGLAKCAYCQSRMRYDNKGRAGNIYLVCSGARRGLNCQSSGKAWRYKDFETSFLMFVQELDLAALTSNQQQAVKRNDLDREILALEGKLALTEQQRDNLIELFAVAGKAKDAVRKKLDDLAESCLALQMDIETKRKVRAELDVEAKGFYEAHTEIKPLIARLQNGDYRLRAEVAAKLKNLISSLTIASVGSAPLLFGSVIPVARQGMDIVKKHKTPAARRVLGVFNSDNSNRRYFSVGFKNGNTRIVFPDDKNPLELEQMVLSAEQDGLQIIMGKDFSATLRQGFP
jgi:DNA invertase Pin-like site-specific DNA recombinase